MRYCIFFGLILASVLLLSSCLMIPAHATSTWTIQTVGEATQSEPISFALGSNDSPQIAYSQSTNGDYSTATWNLTYASWNGSAWGIQTLAPQVRGQGSSLALDSSNNPHICYGFSTSTESDLNYISWTGSNWSIQTIDSSSLSITEEQLALDSHNNPYTLYTEGNNLMFASWTGSNWTFQTIDSMVESSSFYSDSFALDTNNYPHIIYGVQMGIVTIYGESTILYNVNYADWNGSSWNSQTVFSNVTSISNVALDSNGYPHFTYTRNGPLEYASWDGSTWKTQTVDSKPGYNNSGLFASEGSSSGFLVIDQHNNPHTSYWRYNYVEDNSSDVGLTYAYWTGSSWNIQNVDSNGTIYGAGPITLDSTGNPHIAYPSKAYSAYLVDVKYATLTGSTITPSAPLPSIIILSLAIALIAIVLVIGTITYKRKLVKKLSQQTKNTKKRNPKSRAITKPNPRKIN
jgi:hypothetical protein